MEESSKKSPKGDFFWFKLNYLLDINYKLIRFVLRGRFDLIPITFKVFKDITK